MATSTYIEGSSPSDSEDFVSDTHEEMDADTEDAGEQGFKKVEKKRKKGREKQDRSSDEEGDSRDGKRKTNGGGEVLNVSECVQNGAREDVQEQQGSRVRLHFPIDSPLTYQQKVLWVMELGRDHKSFLPLIKEGKYRPYLTVANEEAVIHLTTTGYKGIKLEVPDEKEKTTKIIVFKYPVWLDPTFLLEDNRITWAGRNRVRGEERSQAIAIIKGEAPEKIFITGLGYRYVAPYNEEDSICLRCSRWRHPTWSCQLDPRCRFCAGNHMSTRCGEKIRAGMRIEPRCCNCGGPHNAKTMTCPRRPTVQRGRWLQQQLDTKGAASTAEHAATKTASTSAAAAHHEGESSHFPSLPL